MGRRGGEGWISKGIPRLSAGCRQSLSCASAEKEAFCSRNSCLSKCHERTVNMATLGLMKHTGELVVLISEVDRAHFAV